MYLNTAIRKDGNRGARPVKKRRIDEHPKQKAGEIMPTQF